MAKQFVTSPKGTAVFPYLNSPDTKFDSDGVFRIKLNVEGDAGADFAKRIETSIDKAVASAKEENPGKQIKRADPPFSEEDGVYSFNFKMKHKGKRRDGTEFTRRPVLFDSQGNRCDARVGGGSIVRVSFEPYSFYTAMIGAGVSLRLQAVQVLELVEWGQRNAEGYGFEAEEGFTAEPSESPFESESESDDPSAPEGEGEGDGFDF